jgi:hypothetical protein
MGTGILIRKFISLSCLLRLLRYLYVAKNYVLLLLLLLLLLLGCISVSALHCLNYYYYYYFIIRMLSPHLPLFKLICSFCCLLCSCALICAFDCLLFVCCFVIGSAPLSLHVNNLRFISLN